MGDADGAIEHYKASVAVEPERELPLKRLAELYGMRKDFINGAVTGWSAMWPRNLSGSAINMERWATTTLPQRMCPMRSERCRKGLEVDAYTLLGPLPLGSAP